MDSPERESSTRLSPAQCAVASIAAQCSGPALAPDLRVNVHFHPDRLHEGEPVLSSMLNHGLYRSQFETGTSNGGLTAYPGGDRWRWESRIFTGAYDHASPSQRPKYGALNFRQRDTGASPRFGSAHLRLAASTLARTTFCFPDSYYEPTAFGVASQMPLIALAEAAKGDPLDGYIEAQIHGPLLLAHDVEALVLDPSYRGTEIEALAHRLPFPIEWHRGFRVHIDVLGQEPPYRGQQIVNLGVSVARDGWLNPSMIGDAARSGRYEPQSIKQLWHCIARFGDPAAAAV